jgi:hypothetical protein
MEPAAGREGPEVPSPDNTIAPDSNLPHAEESLTEGSEANEGKAGLKIT